jgi:hypothetical protein
VTETERAEQNTRGPRRRFAQNIIGIAALVLALASFVVVWHVQQQRAENAEISELSLAQQVQAACDSQGSLDLDGRDLCEQADDVIEGTPVTGPAGAQGIPGPQGERGFTGATGPQGRTGPPGEIGPRGPLGPRGETGADGAVGATGEAGATGATGPQGEPGPQGDQGTAGAPGPTGAKGERGVDGRGIAKVECHTTGDWIFTWTDGTASTVTGPCRVMQPTPTPTPTTTTTR